mmetsp:Transcript_24606/g.56789  ORF Transcript_24606/g.56789 Transcript_24606/m.56789 type:complete len:213 (+) Transcript_24606:6-644(+)
MCDYCATRTTMFLAAQYVGPTLHCALESAWCGVVGEVTVARPSPAAHLLDRLSKHSLYGYNFFCPKPAGILKEQELAACAWNELRASHGQVSNTDEDAATMPLCFGVLDWHMRFDPAELAPPLHSDTRDRILADSHAVQGVPFALTLRLAFFAILAKALGSTYKTLASPGVSTPFAPRATAALSPSISTTLSPGISTSLPWWCRSLRHASWL